MARRLRQHLPKNWHFAPGAVSAAIATSTGGCGFQGDNSSGEPQFHLLGGQALGSIFAEEGTGELVCQS